MRLVVRKLGNFEAIAVCVANYMEMKLAVNRIGSLYKIEIQREEKKQQQRKRGFQPGERSEGWCVVWEATVFCSRIRRTPHSVNSMADSMRSCPSKVGFQMSVSGVTW